MGSLPMQSVPGVTENGQVYVVWLFGQILNNLV